VGVPIGRQSEDRSRDINQVNVLQADEWPLQINIDKRPSAGVPVVGDPITAPPRACAQAIKPNRSAVCRIAGDDAVLHFLLLSMWAGVASTGSGERQRTGSR
jgi:hypothetical protein